MMGICITMYTSPPKQRPLLDSRGRTKTSNYNNYETTKSSNTDDC